MPIINVRTQPIILGSSVFPSQPLNLGSITYSAGNWAGDTPGNLNAIADGNPNTATTWGRTYGAGNRGWIQVDLGSVFPRLYLEFLFEIKMEASWSNGNADWFVEVGSGDFFIPSWQANYLRPGSSERLIHLGVFASSVKLVRLGCHDNGGGQGMLRWHDFNLWQLET
jgi:hypothetical protein